MIHGSCLCGAHAWVSDPPSLPLHHCHCGRCRKFTGAAFVTLVRVAEAGFEFARGGRNLPGDTRRFCRDCGSGLPTAPIQGVVVIPAGCLDDDPGQRPACHVFAASKAPWFEIEDGLPVFDGPPPGQPEPTLVPEAREQPVAHGGPVPNRGDDPAAGPLRGGCLCGAVHYVLPQEATAARHCHCARCRKARGAAHASNLVLPADGVTFVAGENHLSSYAVSGARFFRHVFCGVCGSSLPNIDRRRGLAIVPLGGLDGDAPIRPTCHIFVGSKAPWYEIPGELPRYEEQVTS